MSKPAPLSVERIRQLALAPASVQRLIERLTAAEPATRAVGLESVGSALLDPEGEPTDTARHAVPFLIELAAHPRHRGASALLLRLTHALAAVDTPPRSLAGASGTPEARDLYDRFERGAPLLIRCARTSKDPHASNLAACLAARFPKYDAEVEPLLIALLSGARDPDVACRLLYLLTRIQLGRGGALSARIAEALTLPPTNVLCLAVNLAFCEHPLDALRKRRVAEGLSLALRSEEGFVDPRAHGRSLPESALRRALFALEK